MADSREDGLFVCCSHTDQKYREQFTKFLRSESLSRFRLDVEVEGLNQGLSRV